jgi:hypothetical protein
MAKRNSKRVSDQFADRMLKQVRAAPALLKLEEIEEAERNFQSWSVARRSVLATLSKSGNELIDAIEKDRAIAVVFACLLDSIGDYLLYLQSIEKMVGAAQGRLLVALANRVDMDGVLAEAQAKNAARAPEAVA